MNAESAQGMEEKIRRMTPVAAPLDQREGLAAFSRRLYELVAVPHHAASCKLVGPFGEIPLPESAFYFLERVAEVLARGDSLTLVPVGQELTTQQTADILNVSRQYLVRLLNEGQIKYTKTGKHRRLRVEDVLAFKEQRDRQREAKLDELTRMSEDFGLYAASSQLAGSMPPKD